MRFPTLVMTLIVCFPASLAAQNIGFAVGVENPPTRTAPTEAVGVPAPGGTAGYRIPNSGIREYGYGFLPYGGATVVVGTHLPNVPHGGFLPTYPGTAVIVGGSNPWPRLGVSPRHPTAAPTHAVVAPLVFPSPVTGYAPAVTTPPRGVRVIRGGTTNVRTLSAPDPGAATRGIGIGSTRDDVLRAYGQPTHFVADPTAETLIFGGTRVVIQNGVVAFISSY